VNIVATSTEDSSRSGSAAVTIVREPVITSLLPSSLRASGAGGITLRVEGGNFAATAPGPGSIIQINGALRDTACDSNAACWTTLTAADVAMPRSHSVRVQNPDGAVSDSVPLMIAAAASHSNDIVLTAGAPDAAATDITLVDLSTSGSALPVENVNLNVISLSPFQPATASCTLGGEGPPWFPAQPAEQQSRISARSPSADWTRRFPMRFPGRFRTTSSSSERNLWGSASCTSRLRYPARR
jgi:hypothetical protein